MPSFLNKVFGYKKSDDREAARPTRQAVDGTLLDGKYEAVPPVLSPSASTFPEAQQARDSDREGGFSLFKPKSRGVFQKSSQKRPEATPHLTLQLPGLKEGSDSRALGAVFEADPDSQTILDDAVIAAKRLSPLETLILVRACAQAITERGLETLGIMHSHWFSASPNVQRKLISLFIRSLTPQSRITTFSPTPTHPASAFENELHFTRSPHDVAAVLRWGLRHLSLENDHFGKDNVEWAWYNAFFHAERNASYPPKAFSELLLPQLPAPHVELLTVMLNLVSSLASHAESNSISGSKLSKFLGIWLLLATRAEQSDDWNRFYARWEHAGRILEHLFLARLREESLVQRLPTRLQELVKYYPYTQGSLATEEELLPRPRFSTRQYDALFVRVETLLVHNSEQPKQHPIQLFLEAFQLPTENLPGGEHVALWNILKATVSEGATSPDADGFQFTRILADETIHLLSLIPADNNVPATPTLFASPVTKVVSRKRSSSLTKVLERTPVSPTSPSSPVISDWTQFSLSGFGDAPTTQPLVALLDQDDDVEVTQPRISRKSSRRGKSRSRRRRSEDHEPLSNPPSSQSKREPSIVETKLASVHGIQIDEAFIDFWSDAILDPISADWPTFVVCGLKPVPGAELPIHWLVIEQAYSRQQPSRDPSPDGRRGRSPRPSFKSDISGFRINSVFSSARKRFSVFSKSATDLDPKKSGGKTPVAGEFGEALLEEEPTFPPVSAIQVDHHVDGNGAVRTTVTSGAIANVADQPKADAFATAPIAGISLTDPVPVFKEESDSVQAAKVPSVESTPQSGGSYDGLSVLPRLSVRPSEGAVSVEQAARIAPLAADALDLRSTQGTSDPTLFSSGSGLIAEHPVIEEARMQAKGSRQNGSVDGMLVAAGGNLPVESTGGPSNVAKVDVTAGTRVVAEAVAMPPAPETVAVVLPTPTVGDEAPEHIAEEPHVVEKRSRNVPTEFASVSAVESIGQHVDDLLPVPDVQDKVIASEAGAQLEPNSITPVVDKLPEVAEFVEIPTPALEEFVVSVEETPSPEFSVDACGRAWTAQDSAVELNDPALQPVAVELLAPLKVEWGSTIRSIGEPSLETVPAVNTNAHVVVVETGRTADQVPGVATEVQPPIQHSIIQAAGAPLVGALPVPEVEIFVPAAQDVTLTEVEAQAAPTRLVFEGYVVHAQAMEMSTPVPEYSALVDETPGVGIAAEVAPIIVPEFEAAEDKTLEPLVDPTADADPSTDFVPLAGEAQLFTETELVTHVADTPPAEAPSTRSIQKAVTAALATADKTVDKTAELIVGEAQFLTHDAALSANVRVPIEVEGPSSEFTPHPADGATNPLHVAFSVPEEISFVNVETQLGTEVVHTIDGRQEVAEHAQPAPLMPEFCAPGEDTLVVVDAGEPVMLITAPEPYEVSALVVDDFQAPIEVEEPTLVGFEGLEAPALEVDETGGVSEVVDSAERPVRPEMDVHNVE